MFKETIEYEVPKVKELAAEFAKSAKVTHNGYQIELGNYVAEKRSPFVSWMLLPTAKWQIWTREDTPSLKKGFLLACPDMPEEKFIDLMATMQAQDNVSEEDKQEGLKQALQQKLQTLG